ncbi:MAG: hypothetical protein ACOCPN_03470 [Desulfonatronovibrionaceae bacterium]
MRPEKKRGKISRAAELKNKAQGPELSASKGQDQLITQAALHEFYHPRLYWPMFRARVLAGTKKGLQQTMGRGLEQILWKMWISRTRAGKWVEHLGLPRRMLERNLEGGLDISVDPAWITHSVLFKDKWTRRCMGNFFIWDGDWDHSIRSMETTTASRLMQDLWDKRDDLTKSIRYHELMEMIDSGSVYSSCHKGVYLNSREKVLRYLRIYVSFMDQMSRQGYVPELAPDPVGVAVNRKGQLVKINKGMHRMAMARILGLNSITVQVRAVHRDWWNREIAGPGHPCRKLITALQDLSL